MNVGDVTSIISRLHWIYWFNFHQNLQTLEQSYPLNLFNGWKKMYFINNMVVMDHYGFFIYLNFKYPKSYHDGNILHQFDIHKIWCQYCVLVRRSWLHGQGYIHDVLHWETWVDLDVVRAYNKMHTCFVKKLPFHFVWIFEILGLKFKGLGLSLWFKV
jgi:hypothetical protein